MTTLNIIAQLFLSYLKIGFFGFGGGYAMIALIEDEIVVQHGWITASEFADIIAVSQITPGPIAINSATYIGYTMAGIWGALAATTAVCLPAMTLMILITHFFIKLHGNPYVAGTVAGIKPVAIGMIVSAAIMLIAAKGEAASFTGWISWIIFAGALVGSLFKLNPILIIIASAIAGAVIYYPI